MRRIVSAKRKATDSWRTLLQTLPSALSGIVSVITTSSSVDDMIDTAGTLVKAADVLKERGAKKVYSYCTHAVFSGPAIERIQASKLDEVVVTDTIPLAADGKKCAKVRQLSVAFLFAETIRRISDGESVTSLFAEQNSNF